MGSPRAALVVGLVAFVVALVPTLLAHADPPRQLGAEIHDELAKAGVPVVTVRQEGDEYQVVLPPDCDPALVQRCEEIKARVLARKPPVVVVDNLQDALVVLRFEPENESALRLVRERYQELEAAAEARQLESTEEEPR
jgi:hypothetical protein